MFFTKNNSGYLSELRDGIYILDKPGFRQIVQYESESNALITVKKIDLLSSDFINNIHYIRFLRPLTPEEKLEYL